MMGGANSKVSAKPMKASTVLIIASVSANFLNKHLLAIALILFAEITLLFDHIYRLRIFKIILL